MFCKRASSRLTASYPTVALPPMEKGEMTQNKALVGKVIEDICYNNAISYFEI